MNRLRLAMMSLGAACLAVSPAARAQSGGDPLSRAYLFGAAFAASDLSTDQGGGMMFLPGRGLVRWQTTGKSLAEQEELKTEAVGLADAHAVQAEIDARAAAMEQERSNAETAMLEHQRSHFAADARAIPGLNLAANSGTDRQAGAVAPLNRAALKASGLSGLMGVKDGSHFRNSRRLYVFGAVSGRAVGMNLLHDTEQGWRNAGLTTDKGGFIGQRQAGLALRQGRAQAALSYVQEKARVNINGITAIKDHRAMLSFTYVPPLIP